MYQAFYKAISGDVMMLPILALAIFIVVFAGLVVRVMRRPADEVSRHAALPLSKDDEVSHERA